MIKVLVSSTTCGTPPCPKCGAPSECTDHVEVDIGVGIQTWGHQYDCPEHGLWAATEDGVVFRDERD